MCPHITSLTHNTFKIIWWLTLSIKEFFRFACPLDPGVSFTWMKLGDCICLCWIGRTMSLFCQYISPVYVRFLQPVMCLIYINFAQTCWIKYMYLTVRYDFLSALDNNSYLRCAHTCCLDDDKDWFTILSFYGWTLSMHHTEFQIVIVIALHGWQCFLTASS